MIRKVCYWIILLFISFHSGLVGLLGHPCHESLWTLRFCEACARQQSVWSIFHLNKSYQGSGLFRCKELKNSLATIPNQSILKALPQTVFRHEVEKKSSEFNLAEWNFISKWAIWQERTLEIIQSEKVLTHSECFHNLAKGFEIHCENIVY